MHDVELALNEMSQPVPVHSADPASRHFAGRLGGNQEFILDPKNLEDAPILKRVPDASPFISVGELFNLRGFLEPELWKAAVTEAIGTLLLTWVTLLIAVHPPNPVPSPSPTSGIFSTPIFLGPLVGGIFNMIMLPLFIYCLGPVSGGHMNPLITISTFTARLTTFPRMVLYVIFQTTGGILGGLLLRASYGSRDFLAGGCSIDTSLVPIGDIFALEFMADFTLIFLAFGLGLDPRQRDTFGPALGPFLVGAALGAISFATGILRLGHAGASMNPARCMGAFVGSEFPSFGWVIWVGPIAASAAHGCLYWAMPPWTYPPCEPQADSFGSRGGSVRGVEDGRV